MNFEGGNVVKHVPWVFPKLVFFCGAVTGVVVVRIVALPLEFRTPRFKKAILRRGR